MPDTPNISIVIRTFNEARWLGPLLESIRLQRTNGASHEVVVVDSGSTDGTLDIAERFGCRVEHIRKEDFSFGRSLNIGCRAARGEVLVFVSGHCVPEGDGWLEALCRPILAGKAEYLYGRQVGGERSRFSECRIFRKYFPADTALPQEGYFCNNANAALSRACWEQYGFDEELTGLEDIDLARRMERDGRIIGYVAEAVVAHHHDESWRQVRRRFEREALALRKIMPQIIIRRRDLAFYILVSVFKDCCCAFRGGMLPSKAKEIVCYRVNQYLGSYTGNHEHRKLSRQEKHKYFYPE